MGGIEQTSKFLIIYDNNVEIKPRFEVQYTPPDKIVVVRFGIDGNIRIPLRVGKDQTLIEFLDKLNEEVSTGCPK